MVSSLAPLPALLSVALQHLLHGLAELTHCCWGVAGQGMCWQPGAWASELMGTDWVNRGQQTCRPREVGALPPPQLGSQGEACIIGTSS